MAGSARLTQNTPACCGVVYSSGRSCSTDWLNLDRGGRFRLFMQKDDARRRRRPGNAAVFEQRIKRLCGRQGADNTWASLSSNQGGREKNFPATLLGELAQRAGQGLWRDVEAVDGDRGRRRLCA